ncbi:MAG: response regulator [bacterium]|jgi:CheY-like chemotaxis protein|nr:response regulator [bacterium]
MEKNIILCVDDEKAVLDTLRAMLRRAFNGYILEFAESGEEALELLDEYKAEPIGKLVVITDWLMPGMKGDEFLVQVHQKYPSALKIILSGLIDQSGIQRAKEEADLFDVVSKPWDAEALIDLIKKGIEEQVDLDDLG